MGTRPAEARAARYPAAGGGPAGHHRCPAGRRGPGRRHHGRLSARAGERRIADLHPGEAKTDARDAAIIAEAARAMPHTLRAIALADE